MNNAPNTIFKGAIEITFPSIPPYLFTWADNQQAESPAAEMDIVWMKLSKVIYPDTKEKKLLIDFRIKYEGKFRDRYTLDIDNAPTPEQLNGKLVLKFIWNPDTISVYLNDHSIIESLDRGSY